MGSKNVPSSGLGQVDFPARKFKDATAPGKQHLRASCPKGKLFSSPEIVFFFLVTRMRETLGCFTCRSVRAEALTSLGQFR